MTFWPSSLMRYGPTLDFRFGNYKMAESRALRARRMESVGPGVWELKEHDEKTWYRVLYLSRIGNVIHVLHCFEKRSRKTERRDLRIASERLAKVLKRLQQQRAEQNDV